MKQKDVINSSLIIIKIYNIIYVFEYSLLKKYVDKINFVNIILIKKYFYLMLALINTPNSKWTLRNNFYVTSNGNTILHASNSRKNYVNKQSNIIINWVWWGKNTVLEEPNKTIIIMENETRKIWIMQLNQFFADFFFLVLQILIHFLILWLVILNTFYDLFRLINSWIHQFFSSTGWSNLVFQRWMCM